VVGKIAATRSRLVREWMVAGPAWCHVLEEGITEIRQGIRGMEAKNEGRRTGDE
jgi:hypothetical protein